MNKASTNETIYSRYPFAPLVELGLVLAAWLNGTADKAGKPTSTKHSGTIGGTIGHAA